jgi:hypothetical protein
MAEQQMDVTNQRPRIHIHDVREGGGGGAYASVRNMFERIQSNPYIFGAVWMMSSIF